MEKLKSKLFEAATQNSITSLHQLLEDDPLILDRSFVNRFNETPLHVAAMLGHVDFVKEMIALKPQLVNKLNSQRSSSLHLASANGHADVVKALVSVDKRACLGRDRDEMSPLHLAAANGHVEVMDILLEAQPEAIYGGGETILHLCVKRYQLEALKLLVMKSDCDKEFVNSKDSDGNTALHLAVADKQVETIKYLVSVGAVEVNALNAEGITALDILIQSRRDLRDSEIEKTLKNAGGFGTMEKETNRSSSPKKKRKKCFTKQKPDTASWIDNKKGALMVVASLIATMAFQIGVNPPKGLWQEDKFLDPQGNPLPITEQHEAGTSIYVDKDPRGYKNFYIVNTTTFIASLSIILLLVSGLPLRRGFFMWILMVTTWIAIIAIATCYVFAIALVTPTSKVDLIAYEIVYTMSLWTVLIALLLITHAIRIIAMLVRNTRKIWSRWRRSSPGTSTGPVGP